MRERGQGHKRSTTLGTAKEAGLARPLLGTAGEMQDQVFFNSGARSVMLVKKIVLASEVRNLMLVRKIVLGSEVRNPMLVKRTGLPS